MIYNTEIISADIFPLRENES